MIDNVTLYLDENNIDTKENRLKKAKESKLINPLVNQLFTNYVKYWSDQDFNKISEEIYGLPFVLYDQDETTVFTAHDQVISFLKNTFNQLEANDYGYSVTNSFEHYKEDNNIIIIEMNFTRFLKDGRVIWISEQSGYKHLWISKHSGSMKWPITNGKWEVSKIVHINEKDEKIYTQYSTENQTVTSI